MLRAVAYVVFGTGGRGKEQEIGDRQVSCPPNTAGLGVYAFPRYYAKQLHVTVFSRVPLAPRQQVEAVRELPVLSSYFLPRTLANVRSRCSICIRTGCTSALKGPNLVAQGNALGS